MSSRFFWRVAYAYFTNVSANHLPASPQQRIGVILVPTVNALTIRECTKLCDVHGKHPAGSYGFVVLSREYVSEQDVNVDDNIIPYDDNPVEIC